MWLARLQRSLPTTLQATVAAHRHLTPPEFAAITDLVIEAHAYDSPVCSLATMAPDNRFHIRRNLSPQRKTFNEVLLQVTPSEKDKDHKSVLTYIMNLKLAPASLGANSRARDLQH